LKNGFWVAHCSEPLTTGNVLHTRENMTGITSLTAPEPVSVKLKSNGFIFYYSKQNISDVAYNFSINPLLQFNIEPTMTVDQIYFPFSKIGDDGIIGELKFDAIKSGAIISIIGLFLTTAAVIGLQRFWSMDEN